jgi:uncharacterized membrane protein YeaQ/YmgE (transglycosylase-associated protein family)
MVTSIIGWVLFGLIAGAIARFLHPGLDAMGFGGTIILGVLGSLLGGGIAYLLHLGTSPYQPGGWIMSVIGALILLAFGAMGGSRRTRP